MGFSLFTDLITPTKYKIPDAATVDLSGEQLANVESNAASFEAAKGLAEQFNTFMQSQVSKRLRENVHEFEGFQAQASANIAKRLRGELSLGDVAAKQRSSVAGTLGRGTAGSPAGTATVLRDLGLLQYGEQKSAEAALPGYLSAIVGLKNAPLFDFSNVFMSPAQRIQFQFENKSRAWNVQNLKNQMKVQPEPWQKAVAGFGDSVLDAVAAYYTMGASSMGGGGGSAQKSGGFNVGQYQQQNRMMLESGSGGNNAGWGGMGFGEQYSW